LYLQNNHKYLFIGNLQLYEGKEPNPRNSRYVLRPFFVTGKLKEEALKHIDNQIGRYQTYSKTLLITGLGISTALAVYKKFFKPKNE
jgi:hypothetical protein